MRNKSPRCPCKQCPVNLFLPFLYHFLILLCWMRWLTLRGSLLHNKRETDWEQRREKPMTLKMLDIYVFICWERISSVQADLEFAIQPRLSLKVLPSCFELTSVVITVVYCNTLCFLKKGTSERRRRRSQTWQLVPVIEAPGELPQAQGLQNKLQVS